MKEQQIMSFASLALGSRVSLRSPGTRGHTWLIFSVKPS
jgi:hypothetical protein